MNATKSGTTITEAATKSIIAPAAPVNFDDTLSSSALFLVVLYSVKFFLSSSKYSLKAASFAFSRAITLGSDKLTGVQLHPFGRHESREQEPLVIGCEAIVGVTTSVIIVIVDEEILVVDVVIATEVRDKGSSVSVDVSTVECASVEMNVHDENGACLVDVVWKTVVPVEIVTVSSSPDVAGPKVVSVEDDENKAWSVVVSIPPVVYSVEAVNGSSASTLVNRDVPAVTLVPIDVTCMFISVPWSVLTFVDTLGVCVVAGTLVSIDVAGVVNSVSWSVLTLVDITCVWVVAGKLVSIDVACVVNSVPWPVLTFVDTTGVWVVVGIFVSIDVACVVNSVTWFVLTLVDATGVWFGDEVSIVSVPESSSTSGS